MGSTRADNPARPPVRGLRVAQIPPADLSQPASFQTLLARATEPAARQVRVEGLSLRWALRTEADVVHLHWLEFIVGCDPAPGIGLARSLVRASRLAGALAILRARRIGTVWTIHNLRPHEPVRPRIEAATGLLTYLLADEVIAHSEYAAAQARRRFRWRRRHPPVVVPLANYVDAYPQDGPGRGALRDQLGIPLNAYTYLAFGQVRPYKRLERLIAQFRRITDEHARLLIAGRCKDAELRGRLEAAAVDDPRVVLWLAHIPDELVPSLHRASDAGVVAYDDVFSSATLMLGLSFGLAMVAPATGTARELFTEPAVALFSGDDVRAALEEVRSKAGQEQRQAAAAAARAYPWARYGDGTAAAYARAATRAQARLAGKNGHKRASETLGRQR